MLVDKFRNFSKTWAAKAVFILIIISFSIVGIGGIFSSSFSNKEKYIVFVKDSGVKQAEFQNIYIENLAKINPQYTSATKAEKQQALQISYSAAIKKSTLLSIAKSVGLVVSDELAYEVVANTSIFHDNKGSFSQELFINYLKNNKTNEEKILNEVDENIISELTNTYLTSVGIISDKEITRLYNLQNQTMAGRFIAIDESTIAKTIKVSNKDSKKHYENNLSKYKTKDRIKVSFIVLSENLIKIDRKEISKDKIENAYRSYVENIQRNKKVRIEQIIINDGDEKKVKEITNSVNPSNFSKFVQKYSQNSYSKRNKNEIEFIDLADTSAELQQKIKEINVGDIISSPIKNKYGVQFVKLLEVKKEKPLSFSRMKSKLVSRLIKNKQVNKFPLLQSKLEEISYMSKGLSKASKATGLKIGKSGWIYRNSTNKKDIFNDKNLIAAIFKPSFLNSDDNSPLITLEDGRIVVASKERYEPIKISSYKNVKKQIKNSIAAERAVKKINDVLTKGLSYIKDNFNGDKISRNEENKVSRFLEKNLSLRRGAVKWNSFSKTDRYGNGNADLRYSIFGINTQYFKKKHASFVFSRNTENHKFYLAEITKITNGDFNKLEDSKKEGVVNYFLYLSSKKKLSIIISQYLQNNSIEINKVKI